MRRRVLLGLCLAALAAAPAARAQEDALWQALEQGGLVVLLRHATAPGTGDPAGFRLDDCRTQRILSEAGREEARRLGAEFRARGVAVGRVLSSRWCRCLETARLLDLAPVEPFEPLDSFFTERSRREIRTEALRRFVAGWRGPGNALLVTHQVNITALTGIFPGSGEAVLLRPWRGGFQILGRLPPPGA
ncbi:histidine phosphatase family protein [Geminicoccaceae bacterium 1502E]|nr:histidine phosphatase family protein [Geminicoccaceae bacterium 1502E]